MNGGIEVITTTVSYQGEDITVPAISTRIGTPGGPWTVWLPTGASEAGVWAAPGAQARQTYSVVVQYGIFTACAHQDGCAGTGHGNCTCGADAQLDGLHDQLREAARLLMQQNWRRS